MERRFNTLIDTEFRTGSIHGHGTIQNLSESGLFVETKQLPEQGDPVRVRFEVPGRDQLLLTGMVWWTTRDVVTGRRKPGFALRLLEHNRAWDEFVETLR